MTSKPIQKKTHKGILKQKTKDLALKKHAVDIMKQAGSLEFTICYLKNLESEAVLEIERLGSNPLLTKILVHLSKDC